MITNKFGETVFSEQDLCELAMQGHKLHTLSNITVSNNIDIKDLLSFLEHPEQVSTWHRPCDDQVDIQEFDKSCQSQWFMPEEYKHMDIAEYVLNLCTNQDELQRCGQELLLYQEKGLLDLLRYLKYLADIMIKHDIVWGVGRGSSVASYVLYKLGVHKVDSLFYDLDPLEFLR